jgi:hypothetical protein
MKRVTPVLCAIIASTSIGPFFSLASQPNATLVSLHLIAIPSALHLAWSHVLERLVNDDHQGLGRRVDPRMRTPRGSLALLHSFAILKDNKICASRALPRAFYFLSRPHVSMMHITNYSKYMKHDHLLSTPNDHFVKLKTLIWVFFSIGRKS